MEDLCFAMCPRYRCAYVPSFIQYAAAGENRNLAAWSIISLLTRRTGIGQARNIFRISVSIPRVRRPPSLVSGGPRDGREPLPGFLVTRQKQMAGTGHLFSRAGEGQYRGDGN
jgi:hypothetical protein